MTYAERTRLKRMRAAVGLTLWDLPISKLSLRAQTRHRLRLYRLEARILAALKR